MNGRLAEIYFDERVGFYGHCYVDRKTFSRREQRAIDTDTKRYCFTYRNGSYRDQERNFIFRAAKPPWAKRRNEKAMMSKSLPIR